MQMNHHPPSLHLQDSPGYCLQAPEDDISLLLESPTALAAQYNLFSASLLLDSNPQSDPAAALRQTSLGSPDFSRLLNGLNMPCQETFNMTGPYDPNQPLAAAPSLQPLQRPNASQLLPDLLLQAPETCQPGTAPVAATSSSKASATSSSKAADAGVLQLLHQRQQQRYALQNHQQVEGAAEALPAPAVTMPLQEHAQPVAQQAAAQQQGQQRQWQVVVPVPMPAPQKLQEPAAPAAAQAATSAAAAALQQHPAAGVTPPVLQPVQVQVPAPTEHTTRLPAGLFIKTPVQQLWQPEQVQKDADQRQRQQRQQEVEAEQQGQGKLAAMHEAVEATAAAAAQDAAPTSPAASGTTVAAAEVPVVPLTAPNAPVAGVDDSGADRDAGGTTAVMAPVGSSGSQQLDMGSLVWAKFPKFPWWPAVIISTTEAPTAPPQQDPGSSSSSSRPPVLVRFLGTYDAAWLDPGRAVSHWGLQQAERASKTKAAAFVAAMKDAHAYLKTGVVPDAFEKPPQLAVLQQPTGTKKKGKQSQAPTPELSRATTPQPIAPATQPGLVQQPDVWAELAAAATAAAAVPGMQPAGVEPASAAALSSAAATPYSDGSESDRSHHTAPSAAAPAAVGSSKPPRPRPAAAKPPAGGASTRSRTGSNKRRAADQGRSSRTAKRSSSKDE